MISPDRPHSKYILQSATRLYEDATTLSEHLGLSGSISIFGLPREDFDAVEEFVEEADTPGFFLVGDPTNPMWMKHSTENVAVYTQEPPKERMGA